MDTLVPRAARLDNRRGAGVAFADAGCVVLNLVKRVEANPDYDHALTTARCVSFDSMMALRGPDPYTEGFVFRTLPSVPPLSLFCKLYCPTSRWRFWGRKSKARREAENAAALKRIGVPVADWISWGEQRNALGCLRRAFVITEALPSVCRLDEFFQSQPSQRERSEVIFQLSSLVSRMHRAGFFHYDLHWRNVLVQRVPGQPVQLYFVDCPRGGFARIGRARRGLHDLATLDKTAPTFCTPAERLRFLRHYLGRDATREQVRELAHACLRYRRLRWPAAWEANHHQPVDELSEYRKRFQNQRSASHYAARFESGARRRISARETKMVGAIMGSLPNCAVIADIPCGAGRFVPVLAGPGRKLLCFDISPQLLEMAMQRHGGLAEFAVGDASAIPLPDAAVDCAFCNRLLHHFSDSAARLRVMGELRRITRRWAVISFFDKRRGKPIRNLTRWLRRARKKPPECPSKEQFISELQQSGFEIERQVRVGPFWSSQSYFVLRTA